MNCAAVQRALAAESPSDGRTRRVARHIERCGGCRASAEAIARLIESVAEWRAGSAPAGLRARVFDAVASANERAMPIDPDDRGILRPGGSRRGRRCLGRLLVAAPAACSLLFLVMGILAYGQMRRTGIAITDARSAHMTAWRIGSGGGRALDSETWYSEGRWRLERAGSSQVYAGGRLWTYDPLQDRVTYWKAPGPFGHNPSGFSLGAMRRDEPEIGWQLGGVFYTIAGGRLAKRVTSYGPPMYDHLERMVSWVDAATDLPLHAVMQAKERAGSPLGMLFAPWTTVDEMSFEFDRPLPDSLFDPHGLSRTATFLDRDAGYALWRRRLGTPIDTRRIGTRTIALRDVETNAAGDVFALYTAGGRLAHGPTRVGERLDLDVERLGQADLTDDLGTIYAPVKWSAVNPYGVRPGAPNGFVLDGARVDGDWWVPVEPLGDRRPKRYTLTFTFSSYVVYGRRTPPRAEPDVTVRPPSGEDRPAWLTVSFDLPAGGPPVRLLPEWMPFMADGGMSTADVPVARAEALANFQSVHARDPARQLSADEALLAAIDEDHRRTGNPYPLDTDSSSLCVRIGDELRLLGRPEDARKAFERALDDASHPEERDVARQRLQAVGGG